MTEYNYIDLHLHTTTSDGTDSPEELLEHIRTEGIELFSITDHDAVKASLIMPDLLEEGDADFIRGAEFSCRDAHGKYHILGYGYDPEKKAILNLVDQGHSIRMAKTQARIQFLQDTYDMRFPEEEIEELISLDNPGKPHIAKMMIRHGYATSIGEAIGKYINGKKFPDMFLDPQDAISAILRSGGIPVLAHPTYGSGDELILGEEMDQRLQRLIGYGLQGVEGFYSGFTKRIRDQILGFADQYGLYVTAGSDYHGANKLVQIGETELDEAEQQLEGLRRFLRDVDIIKK